ncbi:MAG: tetratricopeptide repeat protein [Proteobacteria bacterium]|nr:tetratricopeptide repeat protein [Pseudomonadota bacterium]
MIMPNLRKISCLILLLLFCSHCNNEVLQPNLNSVQVITNQRNRIYDEEISRLNKAIESNPDGTSTYYKRGEAYTQKGMLYFERGKVYTQKGDYDHAIVDYTRGIELDPNYAGAYISRGEAYYKKGAYDYSIADYSKALELNPNFLDAYEKRSYVFAAKGELDKAIVDISKLIEHYSAEENEVRTAVGNGEWRYVGKVPKNTVEAVGAYRFRASVYRLNGDYENAIADYNKVIAIHQISMSPYISDPLKGPFYWVHETYLLRGLVYADKHDYDNAIADYNSAIKLLSIGGSNLKGSLYYARAMAWFYKKNYDNAWTDVKHCRESGDKPELWFIEALRQASGRNE